MPAPPVLAGRPAAGAIAGAEVRGGFDVVVMMN